MKPKDLRRAEDLCCGIAAAHDAQRWLGGAQAVRVEGLRQESNARYLGVGDVVLLHSAGARGMLGDMLGAEIADNLRELAALGVDTTLEEIVAHFGAAQP